MIVTRDMILRRENTRDVSTERSEELEMRRIVEQVYAFDSSEIAREDLHKIYLFMARFSLWKKRRAWEEAHPDWQTPLKPVEESLAGLDELPSIFGMRITREDLIREYEERSRELSEAPFQTPPPPKGLLLVGRAGRGKTFIASIISSLFHIPFYAAHEIDMAWGENPEYCRSVYPEVFSSTAPVILDDVGAEAGTKHYGNAAIFETLLYRLYENWKYHGKLVIITTNLSMNEKSENSVKKSFGERLESRFCEMFEMARFVGSRDYRKEA